MREVAEGTAAGEYINDAPADPAAGPVTATDANEDPAVLTYTLSGTDAASFDIDRPDGQLKTKAKLDYETKDSYMVTVTATDSDGLFASKDVTITGHRRGRSAEDSRRRHHQGLPGKREGAGSAVLGDGP